MRFDCAAGLIGNNAPPGATKTGEHHGQDPRTRSAADDPDAPFFNDSPKHVVSCTLSDPMWSDSTVLGPYSAGAIEALKDGLDGDLYVSGSGTLVRAMLADGLVDALHLFVFPVVLGSGARLLTEGPTKLTLAAADTYDNGVVHLAYGPA